MSRRRVDCYNDCRISLNFTCKIPGNRLWGLEVNHRATRNRYEHISNLKLMGTYYFNLIRVLLSNMGRDQLSLFSSLLIPVIYLMLVRKKGTGGSLLWCFRPSFEDEAQTVWSLIRPLLLDQVHH